MLAALVCITLFSFKSVTTNEKQLSNLEIYKKVQINAEQNMSNSVEAAWIAAAARITARAGKAVGKGVKKAWQKSSREAVYAAVALWPLSIAKDRALQESDLKDEEIRKSKLSKL